MAFPLTSLEVLQSDKETLCEKGSHLVRIITESRVRKLSGPGLPPTEGTKGGRAVHLSGQARGKPGCDMSPVLSVQCSFFCFKTTAWVKAGTQTKGPPSMLWTQDGKRAIASTCGKLPPGTSFKSQDSPRGRSDLCCILPTGRLGTERPSHSLSPPDCARGSPGLHPCLSDSRAGCVGRVFGEKLYAFQSFSQVLFLKNDLNITLGWGKRSSLLGGWLGENTHSCTGRGAEAELTPSSELPKHLQAHRAP